ncbi:MAG: alpha-glucuronidase family glycosyl hydrolase [Armatimonadota bacterium]
MNRLIKMTLAMVVLLCIGGSSVMANDSGSIRVNYGKTDSQLSKYTKKELSTYLKKLFNDSIDSGNGSDADIIVGTPESNQLVGNAVEDGTLLLPDGKNSDQGYTVKTIGDSIYVTGRTEIGVLYGMYELLNQYGAYFQISGDRLPDKCGFTMKKLDIRVSPVFKYRGVLPWDNFSCGMSGYNLEDYQQLVDHLTRMKFNMLQFHFYPGMAFFTETVNGQTSNPAYIGMPVDVFKTKGAIGEKAFKGLDLYAPKPYTDNIGNPRKQAEAVQAMMRQVIDHAHTRGWKTCLGFELMHMPGSGKPTYTNKPSENSGGANTLNPLDPNNVDGNVQRYRSLVNIYPNSDFYWMWQNEAQGFLGRNVGKEPGAKEFREKYDYWNGDDTAFGPRNCAGDMDYAYMFLQVANKLTSAERSKLATGGWSVEHLFPGIDKDFPSELIFASLNTYDPVAAVKSQIDSYRVAKGGRQAWMIDWWEFDGNQWFPQYRASYQEDMYKKCAEFGVESVTLLGWKISAIEHNVRYLSDFSWNPKLSAKKFYTDYSARLYGKSAAKLGADYYMPYDKYDPVTPGATPADARYMLLGAGWMGLAVPTMPIKAEGLNDQAWKDVVERAAGDICGISGQKKYYEMDQKAIAEFKALLPGMDEQGKSWAKLMINRLEFRSLYLQSMMALNESFIMYDKVGREKGIKEARIAAYPLAKKSEDLARQAVKKYAQDIRNRGDQGVLAQLNEQFYQIVRRNALLLQAENPSCSTVDWTTFRIKPSLTFDFSSAAAWTKRDGKVELTSSLVDGKPTLKLTVGGDNVPFNSAFISIGGFSLDDAPFMDLRIRTTAQEPFAIMFQVEDDQSWYVLNFMGTQRGYQNADSVASDINDGKWHRVTWDLKRLAKEKIGGNRKKITSMIIGSWESPSAPIEVEFQDFTLGKRNMLD